MASQIMSGNRKKKHHLTFSRFYASTSLDWPETHVFLHVSSFVCMWPNLRTRYFQTDEPILLHLGKSDPRGKGMKRSTSGIGRSKVKVIRGRSHFWRPGAYFLILTYRLRFCLWTWLELAI